MRSIGTIVSVPGTPDISECIAANDQILISGAIALASGMYCRIWRLVKGVVQNFNPVGVIYVYGSL